MRDISSFGKLALSVVVFPVQAVLSTTAVYIPQLLGFLLAFQSILVSLVCWITALAHREWFVMISSFRDAHLLIMLESSYPVSFRLQLPNAGSANGYATVRKSA